jgi:hypothetical protein
MNVVDVREMYSLTSVPSIGSSFSLLLLLMIGGGGDAPLFWFSLNIKTSVQYAILECTSSAKRNSSESLQIKDF